MEDPQVTMAFNTKWFNDLDDLGVPAWIGNLHFDEERSYEVIKPGNSGNHLIGFLLLKLGTVHRKIG